MRDHSKWIWKLVQEWALKYVWLENEDYVKAFPYKTITLWRADIIIRDGHRERKKKWSEDIR